MKLVSIMIELLILLGVSVNCVTGILNYRLNKKDKK
jgi:hypothetical protein